MKKTRFKQIDYLPDEVVVEIGADAEVLSSNKAFQKVFESLEDKAVQNLVSAKETDVDTHHYWAIYLRVLRDIYRFITAFAEENLERKRKNKKVEP